MRIKPGCRKKICYCSRGRLRGYLDPSVSRADPCVSRSGTTNTSGIAKINLKPHGSIANTAINLGIPYWQECDDFGVKFPRLVNNSPGDITVDVFFDSGIGATCAAADPQRTSSGQVIGGSITIYAQGLLTNCIDTNEKLGTLLAHEVGHIYGLDNADSSSCNGYIMGRFLPDAMTVQDSECEKVDEVFETPTESNGGGAGGAEEQSNEECNCPPSPVLISTINGNYELSSRQDGVFFDLNADGEPELTAWTVATSDEAFLVLDRNGNGQIDDGTELFGDHSEQPPSEEPNGFLALAEWDTYTNGGNEDGRIDSGDGVFHYLRLWIDRNHNGFSEASELWPLHSLGFLYIDLDYSESGRTDQYGNEFRFKSKAGKEHGVVMAWDVFFAL